MMHAEKLKAKTHTEVWMVLENPDRDLDEAVRDLRAVGNEVLQVDYENRRILVAVLEDF